MMESVVAQGTGKNAQVSGYSVGGKTGTSEDGVNTNKYVSSFVGVAPVSDPQVVILITLYNPTGEGGHQGGGVAAPIASQVLTDVLAYLEISKDNQEEGEEEETSISVPELRGKSIKEATQILKEAELGVELKQEENQEIDKTETVVTQQLPLPGVKVKKGSKIEIEY